MRAACCAVEWPNRNRLRSPPGAVSPPAAAISYAVAMRPHSRCWRLDAGRKAEAEAALATMGSRRPRPIRQMISEMGRMMGGFDQDGRAGRDAARWKPALDQVNRLRRVSSARLAGRVAMDKNGERVAWINLHADADCLHLSYRVRIGGVNGRMWRRPSASSTCPRGDRAVLSVDIF
jgi:hypothetical protein